MQQRDDTLDGAAVRQGRQRLGLSVRQLASLASVSPAYVTAIETGRSSSTGRPPVVSLAVARRLADALELPLDASTRSGRLHQAGTGSHVLAYLVAEPAGGLLPALDALYGDGVDHWLHICDPRERPTPDTPRVTTRRFPLGSLPYPTPDLDPDALVAAMDEVVSSLAPTWRGKRVGLLIADCSAVLRYLQDANAGVELERTWHDRITAVWAKHLRTTPAVDVCAYREQDMRALGLTVDQLGTALALVERHDEVLVIDRDSTVSGARAIVHILDESRPTGTVREAWQRLTAAAAHTLASRS